MSGPVAIGIGGDMGVVVADSTIHFAHQLDGLDLFLLALQAISDVGELFAQRGRCEAGWPWVRLIIGVSASS